MFTSRLHTATMMMLYTAMMMLIDDRRCDRFCEHLQSKSPMKISHFLLPGNANIRAFCSLLFPYFRVLLTTERNNFLSANKTLWALFLEPKTLGCYLFTSWCKRREATKQGYGTIEKRDAIALLISDACCGCRLYPNEDVRKAREYSTSAVAALGSEELTWFSGWWFVSRGVFSFC